MTYELEEQFLDIMFVKLAGLFTLIISREIFSLMNWLIAIKNEQINTRYDNIDYNVLKFGKIR